MKQKIAPSTVVIVLLVVVVLAALIGWKVMSGSSSAAPEAPEETEQTQEQGMMETEGAPTPGVPGTDPMQAQ